MLHHQKARIAVLDDPTPLASFYEDLGEALFGQKWPDAKEEEDINRSCYERMISILGNEERICYVSFVATTKMQPRASKPIQTLDVVGDGLDWGWPSYKMQDGKPCLEREQLVDFEIDARFWVSDEAEYAVFAPKHRLHVPADYLYVDNASGRFEFEETFARKYYATNKLNCEISVRFPKKLLRRLGGNEASSLELQSREHRRYTNELTMDLIALCWRFIAIERPDPSDTLVTLLYEMMSDYLAENRLKNPCEATRQQIAKRVCYQLRERRLKAPLRVSTKSKDPINA